MNKTETDRIVVNVLKVCSGMTQLETIKKTLQLAEEEIKNLEHENGHYKALSKGRKETIEELKQQHQREINTFEALKRNNESWKEDFKKLYDILNEQHQKEIRDLETDCQRGIDLRRKAQEELKELKQQHQKQIEAFRDYMFSVNFESQKDIDLFNYFLRRRENETRTIERKD